MSELNGTESATATLDAPVPAAPKAKAARMSGASATRVAARKAAKKPAKVVPQDTTNGPAAEPKTPAAKPAKKPKAEKPAKEPKAVPAVDAKPAKPKKPPVTVGKATIPASWLKILKYLIKVGATKATVGVNKPACMAAGCGAQGYTEMKEFGLMSWALDVEGVSGRSLYILKKGIDFVAAAKTAK